MEVHAVKLLVVDDDTFVRIVLALELPDVELLEAGSIDEGYRLALDAAPDAIVVDRKLADGDGLQLVRRLRQNFATFRTPIVLLTAGYDPASWEEVVMAGADEYVGKPFEAEVLLSRIERLRALPGAHLRPRRNEIVEALRTGVPVEIDLTAADHADHADQGHAVEIDLAGMPSADVAAGRWWRRRRLGAV